MNKNDQKYELTIIMSNYNQEKVISKAIDSVFAQIVNFRFKLIITDDYSCEDKSIEIIKSYAKKHDNIEMILSCNNGGYLTNILRAKENVKTKYFCLLDADDYWTDRYFLQRAYDFLNTHGEYAIYEANVMIIAEDKDGNTKFTRPMIPSRHKSGTYSKTMFLNNENVPITQTTGMFFRNTIFIDGIPGIMKDAIKTRSERSFEGDTGRFIMHLKTGLAYYDKRVVGVYRLTEKGIWSGLANSKQYLISARMYLDYYKYYNSNVQFFVTKSYRHLQNYLFEKQKELIDLNRENGFIDDEERLMVEDVYLFCKRYENEINKEKCYVSKLKRIIKMIRI